ncbi:MAG TPA: Crp/Fnr family transcriptional regulator [Bacteroidetes bacterium]|nr:Crp/Fnr family transcriptional regulator [Bacteroidota bacterium]
MGIESYIQDRIVKDQLEGWEMPFPTQRVFFKKNEIITRFGQLERKAYLLVRGVIESAIERGGEEKIIDFVFPQSFICSYTSFLQQIPSEIQTKAITDCEVEYFLKEDLEAAYRHSLVANWFGRSVTEQFLIKKLKRENSFLTKSAKENYLELLEEYPEVLKMVPVYKIAKYLGIHPESLSRIRSEIIS